MTERVRSNRLAGETSPYLLQHAGNPVDWYPWGPEALATAQKLDRPILLSIGYSACHWCHVMERECFEDEAIARLMNEHFVCVKVDREERPDLDDIYMSATVALSGSGGWPMTVFLAPDQRPFFAGTYFPPEDRHGRPGFPTLLERIAELWKTDREALVTQAAQLTEQVVSAKRPTPPGAISRDSLRQAYRALAREFDPAFGGFGRAPKFPPSAALSLLLRYYRISGEPHALAMVTRTLDGMKNGGIYDQLGGGFARYSVDDRWLVPHFEKMLYDNAQLVDVYLEAFAVTTNSEYRRVARETLDYVVREMQGPAGGYFSSSDADSEGEEGKYFVWRLDEVRAVLDDPLAERFCLFFGVTPEGNWEGTNVLHTPYSLAGAAHELGLDQAELSASLAEARARMGQARSERVPPPIDDKVLTSWNGLMVRAMAHGYRQLRDERYLDSARRAADFVLQELRRPDGGLYRTARAGHAHLDAYLEDYAYFVDGLLSLYEVSGTVSYLEAARELAERMVTDFAPRRDEHGALLDEGGAFYHTAHSHEELLVRPREGHDGALPNPNAVACRALGRLAGHLGREDLRRIALDAALGYGRQVQRHPRAFATLLGAVDFLLEPPLEIVLAEGERADEAEQLERVLAATYLPNRIEARVTAATAVDPEAPPLVRGKTPVEGRAAVYLCENFVCQAPVTAPAELEQALTRADQANRQRALRELGRPRLAGGATAEGTARFAGRSELGGAAYAPLPPTAETPLLVSRIGFDGHGLGLDHPEHRNVVETALARGVNLFDTAPGYGRGDSERLIGECLAEAVEAGGIARDEIVLVTKVGLARGADRERIADRAREGRPYSAVTLLDARGADDSGPAYCLDPEFLREQLTGSLERLGVETVDACLLENPELLLAEAVSGLGDPSERRTRLLSLLEAAFRHLEGEVAAGRIGWYGVSIDPTTTAESLEVPELWAAAERAAGKNHHFRVLELPLNLAETEVLRGRRKQAAMVEQARELGLALLTHRPLHALVGGTILRLSDPEALPPEQEPLDETRQRVAALEEEFERDFAPGPRSLGIFAEGPLFGFGGQLGAAVERAQGVQQLDHVETTFVKPRLGDILAQLEQVFAGAQAERYRAWRSRYVEAVGAWLLAVRQHASEHDRRLLERLDEKLRIQGELRLALDGPLATAPWSLRALALVRGIEGVSSVLVSMRRRDELADALHSLRLPVPRAVYRSLARIEPLEPESSGERSAT